MFNLLKIFLITLFILCLFSNCKTYSTKSTLIENDQGISLSIKNLDCCDDFEQQVINLDPQKEVFILVHGCKASSGHFTTLKKVFELRGQQAICFSYDFRDSIESCSAHLLTSINALSDFINPPLITIIGHSQGGLISRRAIISNRLDKLALKDYIPNIRLVTVSSPFNGIKASSHCGIPALHILTVGITALICEAIAGSTWSEINPTSDFINKPGDMSDRVFEHLKINTDENDTCRTYDENGNCIEDDYVFALDEQYSDEVDKDVRVVNVEMKAGHAQVVGKPAQPPFDLIALLEEYNVLKRPTELTYLEDNALLKRLYQ